MKLHFREMLEPTGLWQEEITHGIQPMHEALLAVLCRHFGVAQADDELQRLAVCICGLGVHLHVGHDVIDQVAPQLNQGADALDRWSERLVIYALAMIDAERQRRGGAERMSARRLATRRRQPAAWRLRGLRTAGADARADTAAAGGTRRLVRAAGATTDGATVAATDGQPAQTERGVARLVAAVRRPGAAGADRRLMAASPTVAAAASRIEQARASSVAAGAALLPALNADASGSTGRSELRTPRAGYATANLQASWELDLFGANQAGRDAAVARLQGAQASLADARWRWRPKPPPPTTRCAAARRWWCRPRPTPGRAPKPHASPSWQPRPGCWHRPAPHWRAPAPPRAARC